MVIQTEFKMESKIETSIESRHWFVYVFEYKFQSWYEIRRRNVLLRIHIIIWNKISLTVVSIAENAMITCDHIKQCLIISTKSKLRWRHKDGSVSTSNSLLNSQHKCPWSSWSFLLTLWLLVHQIERINL